MSALLGRLFASAQLVRSALAQSSASTSSSFASSSTGSASLANRLHTSAIAGTWGGGKLKTHSGTAKRFKAVGKRFKPQRAELVSLPTGDIVEYAPLKAIGPMFKRGRTGKRHLNTKMSSSQGARLRGTTLHESGHTIRVLNRLIGNH